MLSYCSNIGTTFQSKKWLTLDPCGIGCVAFSYFFHIIALTTIHETLISHSFTASILFYVLYCPSMVLALCHLFMAQHTDPGAIPLGARPLRVYEDGEGEDGNGDGNNDEDSVASHLLDGIDVSHAIAPPRDRTNQRVNRTKGIRRCRKCHNNYKPPRSHHDSVTGRCVSKFDHFCPWVGNAVGALNHKFFVLFIFYTFWCSGLSLLLIFMRFVRCGYTVPIDGEDEGGHGDANGSASMGASSSTSYNNWTDTGEGNMTNGEYIGKRFLDDTESTGTMVYAYEGCYEIYTMRVLFLIVISICFLVFTCCMLFEQIDAIESNTSKIARMKMRMGQDDGEYGKVGIGFNEMFGVGFGSRGHGQERGDVGLHWFLPTQVQFPSQRERDQVLGYEFREEWAGRVYDEDQDEELGSCGNSVDGNMDDVHSSAQPPVLGRLGGNSTNRRQTSSSLMVPDDDLGTDGQFEHDRNRDRINNKVVEIELPSGTRTRGLERSRSNGSTVNKRLSIKMDCDSSLSSQQSSRIV